MKILNLIQFSDLARGQNSSLSSKPTKLSLFFCLPQSVFFCLLQKKIDYSNILEIVGLGQGKNNAISWLHYDFSALDSCDMRIE